MNAYLALERFLTASRLPLRDIRFFVLLYLSIFSASSSAQTRPLSNLEVAVSQVRRTAREAVELSIELSNKGIDTVLVPEIQVSDVPQIFSLQVLHRDLRGGWESLRRVRDVPTDNVAVLRSGQTMRFAEYLHDPAIIQVARSSVSGRHLVRTPLGGTYKIVVGYSSNEEEWRVYSQQLKSGAKKPKFPQLRFVESGEFAIAPTP